MKLLIRFLLYIFACFLIISMHLTVVYLFPKPFAILNVVFVMLVSLLMVWENGILIWLSFFLHMVLEIYITTTPYGVVLFSGTMAILIVYSLLKYVFTNRSWYIGMALGAISVMSYRLIYVCLLIVVKILTGLPSVILWHGLFINFLWELLITSVVIGIVLFLGSLFLPELRGSKVVEKFGIGFRKI